MIRSTTWRELCPAWRENSGSTCHILVTGKTGGWRVPAPQKLAVRGIIGWVEEENTVRWRGQRKREHSALLECKGYMISLSSISGSFVFVAAVTLM